jgi:hypothetical protein
MTEPAGTIELLIGNANGSATGDDVVRWAMNALTAGFDSPTLRRLAGEQSPRQPEAIAMFERAMQELGLKEPESNDALRREFLRIVAADIVNGARAPLAALDLIHQEVINPLRHPDDLMAWCYLWEGNDPKTFASLEDEAIEEATRALARDSLK